MNGQSVLLAFSFVLLYSLRNGCFHTNYYAMHDSIYGYRKLTEFLLSVFSFAIITVGLSVLFRFVFHAPEDCILWGVGFGAFLMVWPVISSCRLYAFADNPVKLLYFLLNTFEILFAVGIAALICGETLLWLFVFAIPLCGSLARRKTDEVVWISDLCVQTRLYLVWKRIRMESPAFLKKYGSFISEAARTSRLPEKMLLNMLLIEKITRGAWYYRLPKWLMYRLFPRLAVRCNMSLGLGQIKTDTVRCFYGEMPEHIYDVLNDPRTNIQITAWLMRRIIDSYPGSGQYLDAGVLSSPVGALEYDALDEPAQLCRYIMSMYEVGSGVCRRDFVTIGMDIMLKSDAQLLLNYEQKEMTYDTEL